MKRGLVCFQTEDTNLKRAYRVAQECTQGDLAVVVEHNVDTVAPPYTIDWTNLTAPGLVVDLSDATRL